MAEGPSNRTSHTNHIVLCGLDKLAFRILEQLTLSGNAVTVIAEAPDESFEQQAIELGAVVVRGDYRDEPALRDAGVGEAAAIVLAADDDIGNVHAALTAQELHPDIRIVLRMFNVDFGRQVQTLFNHCLVVSASSTAAPSFVAAALYRDDVQRFILSDHVYGLRQALPNDSGVLLPIARLYDDGAVSIFPDDDAPCLCLVNEGTETRPSHPEPEPARTPRLHTRPHHVIRETLATVAIDRRFYYLVAVMAVLGIISTVIFNRFAHLGLIDALYFTINVMTSTGFGNITIVDAPAAIKLYGAVLMLTGAAALATVYALITDAIIRAHIAGLGDQFARMSGHVVVSGMGTVGFRIAEQLTRLGVPVVGVELREDDSFIASARQLGIPVLIADTRVPSTLQTLHIDRASCLIAATDDDVANLQAALNARASKNDIRVVMRLFDPDFAQRVQRTFKIDACYSVSSLSAPAFAAAATGLPVVATLPVGSDVLVVARFAVDRQTELYKQTVGTLEESCQCRVLFLDEKGVPSHPNADATPEPGREMVVIGDHAGLTRFWAQYRPRSISGATL
jgi:Trk K+ transport system NAD-binding subunit